MVLIYAGRLPAGALVARAKPKPPPAPLWLEAQTGLTITASRLQAWTARAGTGVALPVPANPAGTLHSPAGLQFETGENSGLVLSGAIEDGASVTFGAVLTPGQPEARTLLSLQPVGSEDYALLSLDGGHLRLTLRDGQEADLVLPHEARPLLVLCGLSGGEARLSVNGGPAFVTPLPLPHGPAELFIGCRNGKGGMKGKLGRFLLTDVLVWPFDLLRDGDLGPARALWHARCTGEI